MSEEEKFRFIEEYIAGRLSDKDEDYFIKELAKNPLLKEEVKLHDEVHQSIIEVDLVEFRNNVKKVIDQKSASRVSKWYNSKRVIGIAASLLIIMALSFLINLVFFKPSTNENLYAEYFRPYEDLITGRSDNNIEDQVALAMRFYSQKEYEKAALAFKSISSKDKPLVLLYESISYMCIGNLPEATNRLNELLLIESVYTTEAKWYLALNYLKEGKIENTKLLLMEIQNSSMNSNYKKIAEDLHNKL